MSPPSYTIRPVEHTDIPALAEILYMSKLALTINRLLFKDWPNATIQRQNYLAAIQGTDSPGSESLSVVDNESGEVIGHLALTRRPANDTERPEDGEEKSALPDFFNPEVVTAVLDAVAHLARGTKTADHYEVTYIVIKPGYRQRGIGKNLMKYVFDKANTAGVPVTVNAEPQTYEFFKRFGFRDANHVDFDLAKWAPPYSGFGLFRLAGMIWDP
ncbi:hypothetical protein BBP40_007712 [Aspergillus hancockii]|nr:hypothetical protein BBP40_007712 [Aspergillus hancockii]